MLVASPDVLRALAAVEDGQPVLSLYLRTDPRDPANTAQTPGWGIAMRNGLRDVEAGIEERDELQAFRALREHVEGVLDGLEPADRGRGVAWFINADRSVDTRLTLQLPPREDVVRCDVRPFISPLVDLTDSGRATGLVLVGGDVVRLLQWEAGRVEEPANSVWQLELGDWREYAAYAMANPARGQQTATHVASFDQRVDEWRRRFLTDAAEATLQRVEQLGWDRLVVAAEGQVATAFTDSLPQAARARVVATLDANLVGEDAPVIAERLAQDLEHARTEEIEELIKTISAEVDAGGRAVSGLDETFDALVQGRVSHLVLDPHRDFDPAELGPQSRSVTGDVPARYIAERAVELAIAAGGAVAMAYRTPDLDALGGIAASLRY